MQTPQKTEKRDLQIQNPVPLRYMERYTENREILLPILQHLNETTVVDSAAIAFSEEGLRCMTTAATDVSTFLFMDLDIPDEEKVKYLHSAWHIYQDNLYLLTEVPAFKTFSIALIPKEHWKDRLELEEPGTYNA